MKSGRSKHMIKLVEEQSRAERISRLTNYNQVYENDDEDCIPGTPECYSPLPPEAHKTIQQMNEICKDVFEDEIHETNKENTALNIQSPNSVLREDHLIFMPVDRNESPYLPATDNQQHVESLNITSVPTPLDTSTLIPDLSPFPQPTPPTNENNIQTPIPSPTKTHSALVVNDVFCPSHDKADYDCPSINTVASSCQSSPAAAIRCRGKKRLRNYDNWEEVKRKRLKNEGKSYRSKKGNSITAKSMRRPCTCRYKCESKLTPEDRKDAFEKFWKLGDREKQWLHVANYTM